MRVSEAIACAEFPCAEMRHEGYRVPSVELDPAAITMVLIAEAAAPNAADDFYAPGEALYARTTLEAFHDAGLEAASVADLLAQGVYLTTAVKCSKVGYAVARATVLECSMLLERELALFPNVRAYLLMGDVAIQAVNAIAKRQGRPRPIPAGSTYKIRGGEYFFQGARAFPSYLQAGPAFYIEKTKRQMIAQDIAAALALIGK